MPILSHLKPEAVFNYFEKICEIPHGSRNMEPISDYLISFAKEKGLSWYRDESFNVVIYKEASEGYEDGPVTILQGHMDMVAEKTADSLHDFDTEGLQLGIDGDDIFAKDTTLGGDDGIAVAYMLAILEDDTLPHPALECVFTANEEIGLLGANALDTSVLKGKTMINMDSSEEGRLWISCAGGRCGISTLPVIYQDMEGCNLEITIDGLIGGHSGAEIHKIRANAIELMGRFLYELKEIAAFSVAELSGGAKDNAIPRSSRTVLVVEPEEKQVVLDFLCKFQEKIRTEYSSTDDQIQVRGVENGEGTYPALSMISREKVIFYLMHLPYGVQKMSGDIEGLVETSCNPGIMNLYADALVVTSSMRSSVGTAKEHVSHRIQYLTEFLGGDYRIEGDYPAWEYRKDSPLRDLMVGVYEECFGEKPAVEAIHAGLECGLFYDKIPGLDCVSLGPDMEAIHTTEERLSISSVQRVWMYLTRVLAAMKK